MTVAEAVAALKKGEILKFSKKFAQNIASFITEFEHFKVYQKEEEDGRIMLQKDNSVKENFIVKDYPNAKAFIVYGDTQLAGKITVANFYYDYGLSKQEVKKIAEDFALNLNDKHIEIVQP